MAPGKLATSLVPLLLHSFGRRWSRLVRWEGRQAFKGGYKAVFPSTTSKVIYWESFEYYIGCGRNLPKSCTIYLQDVHKDDLKNRKFSQKGKKCFFAGMNAPPYVYFVQYDVTVSFMKLYQIQ